MILAPIEWVCFVASCSPFRVPLNPPAVYHVFEQGELETLVEEAASQMPNVVVRHETSGWERGNWYGIWQCIEGV